MYKLFIVFLITLLAACGKKEDVPRQISVQSEPFLKPEFKIEEYTTSKGDTCVIVWNYHHQLAVSCK